MEIMAFLLGAAARQTASSTATEVAVVGRHGEQAAAPRQDTNAADVPPEWPGHWAAAKYL